MERSVNNLKEALSSFKTIQEIKQIDLEKNSEFIMTNDLGFLLDVYERMLLLRRFEEKVGQFYGIGKIGGFCHLYVGQEAIAVGIIKSLKDGDALITSYRDHGFMIALGANPDAVMAELLGRSGGCSKGKGGSMHMFDPSCGFYGGHGIVGAQVPLGTGIAFGMKYKNTKNISCIVMGDGAINQGQVYESFNIAALWDLPALYMVENNMYAMGTSVNRSSSTPDSLFKRGLSFGIPGFVIDGMNVEDVYNKTLEAVEYVRNKNKPLLIEYKCYRYRGHSMSDPATYRAKEELNKYKNYDPIEIVKKKMIELNINEYDLKMIETKVKDIINQAIKFSENSPLPNIEELFLDIYI